MKLTERPGSRLEIGHAFFGTGFQEEHLHSFRPYFEYYIEELELLRTGIREESWQIHGLATTTYEDVFFVVAVLQDHGDSCRPEIRSLLRARLQCLDTLGLNRSINLAMRLWLMINVQDPEFEGNRHGVSCVQWDDESTLKDFVRKTFPQPQWQVGSRSSRLGPHFTAVFMQRVCGLKIEWTTNLRDHLLFDRRRRCLKVFPYKCHLQAMIDSQLKSNDRTWYSYWIVCAALSTDHLVCQFH